jgi:hypothetical protein
MADDAGGFGMFDDLPKLVLGGGRAQSVLHTLETALAGAGNIFRQGEGPNLRGLILREPSEKQVKDMERRGIHGTRGLLLPIPLTRSHVQDYAERNFTVVRLWKNPKTGEIDELSADFSPTLATRLIEARLDGLRPLNGIAYTPILRADGTLVRAAGYDEQTGLWTRRASTCRNGQRRAKLRATTTRCTSCSPSIRSRPTTTGWQGSRC